MKTSRMLICLVPLLLGLAACGEGEEQSEACQQAEAVFGDPTQFYGEDCTEGSNTGCEENFNNCAEGICEFTGVNLGESICTEECSTDADCPAEIPVCAESGVCVSTTTPSTGGGTGTSTSSCSSCLSACQGFSSCCCGSGCICESSCTPTCGDA